MCTLIPLNADILKSANPALVWDGEDHAAPQLSVIFKMNTEKYAKFRVVNHYFLEGRGAFVLGEIHSGTFKIGMKVNIKEDGNSFTISGIEFLDNLKQKTFLNALLFKEMPELNYLKNAFPIGSIIKAEIAD